ncbi:MAG: caspase family protein [bacterium]
MMRWWILAALLFATASHAAGRRFALIVAENRPFSGDLAPLRYADDDGVRYRRLFELLEAETELLTVLDDETQHRYPAEARTTRPPTRAALEEALGRLNAKMEKARAAGDTAEFYFVFAGHGQVGPDGEGFIHLRDGVLTRSELLHRVVGASKADFNHLILDACHASAMVFKRGEAEHRPEDYRALIGQYLAAGDLDAWPNTGVLLAASKDEETHEWEPFRAGVFSHEVRSGLLGAADTNGDGYIEYTELGAYVAAANLSISVAAARPQVVARPPAADRHRALSDITDGPQHFLSLPKDFRGRAWLEDERGDRYADFNAAGDAPVVIALADTRYYLRRPDEEAIVALDRPGTLTALTWRPRSMAQRGAVDDAFRRELFGVGFGPGFYQGFVSRARIWWRPTASATCSPAAGHRRRGGSPRAARGLGRGPGSPRASPSRPGPAR